MDLSGVELLQIGAERRRAAGGDLFIVVHYPPLAERLGKLGLMATVGEGRFFEDKGAGIAAAIRNTPDDTCACCDKRVFEECAERPDRRASTADAPGKSLTSKALTRPT